MEAYKQEFIEFMVDNKVLKFGDFTLKSGRKSPFFMNAGGYVTGSQLRKLGEYYAKAIHDNYGDDFDVLFGPAYKGIPLAVSFVILVLLCNLFMTSGSSKWLILAPIFVPMFAQIGFSPSLTQCAYRVGDSITNCIAPINFFLPIIIGIMNKYKAPEDPEFGLGTLSSYMLPYSIALGIVLIVQLVLWMLIGLPLGPGVALYI